MNVPLKMMDSVLNMMTSAKRCESNPAIYTRYELPLATCCLLLAHGQRGSNLLC